MLVLSRKPGQAIWISDDIEVTVLQVSGSRVRLGISAPEHVRITRSELREARQAAWEPQVVTVDYAPHRDAMPQRPAVG